MSLLLLVLCATTTTSIATDVVVLPLEVAKEFVCTSPPGRDYIVSWGVNGSTSATIMSQFQDYVVLGEEVLSENGGTQRSLTFKANARANSTRIRCVVSNHNNGEYMVPYDINIILQGHLPPPNVTYEMSKTMFSWSAPFTLNISDMEPDILHYVVYIIRDDGHNETVNTTDTHYELQADQCQSHQYHVEIAAVNIVGEGEKYISPEITLEASVTFDEMYRNVLFDEGNPKVEISLEVTPNCFNETTYEVELQGKYSNSKQMLNYTSSSDMGHMMFTSKDVEPNELYNYSVKIGDLMLNSSEPMLSTFDVQHVYIEQHDEYVNITCHFAHGSNARGCKIEVKTLDYISSSSCEILASRNENQANVTFGLLKGSYEILVYDKEYDSTVSKHPFSRRTMSFLTSMQVTECEFRSENNVSSTSISPIIWITLLVPSILFVVGVTVIISICFCKRKGKHPLPDVEMNDYYNPASVHKQPMRSPSSESSDSARSSSQSDSSEQTTGSNSTAPLLQAFGHSHYADLQVTEQHTIPRPPPTCSDEPVNYATIQLQKAADHSHQQQGYMDTGVPGPYTPDDSN